MRHFAAFLVLLALLIAAASSVQAADTTAGKAIFDRLCVACHGPNAVGANGPALNTAAFARRYNTGATLGSFVRRGARGMPAFASDVLTDADLENLVAYLDSLAPAGSISPAPASTIVAAVSTQAGNATPAPVAATSAPAASAPASSAATTTAATNSSQSLPLQQIYAIAVIALAAVNGLVMVLVWIVVNRKASG